MCDQETLRLLRMSVRRPDLAKIHLHPMYRSSNVRRWYTESKFESEMCAYTTNTLADIYDFIHPQYARQAVMSTVGSRQMLLTQQSRKLINFDANIFGVQHWLALHVQPFVLV